MVRVSQLLLLAGLVLPAAWPQQSYPFFSPSPAAPLLVTATANSPFGQSSYCYWVVVVYPIGKSTPSSPSCLSNAIETSSVLISWSAASGASSYDVLRTTTPILPNVTSSIAVATAVSGTTQTDSFGALSSYSIASAVPATANLYLDNTAFSTPQLRAIVTGVGGTSAFNLGSGGGGTPGGSSGQVQYNNSGAFGGFTVSGDGTLNTGTGVLTVTQVNGGAVPTSAKLISTNASKQLVAAAAETAPITVSATGGIACATCATTTNGGALSATSPATISAAGVIACATCATTTNGGALSATSPATISAAGVIACATCATTTNGGTLTATSPATISAAGVIACATCATTTNGGALSGTAPITLSAAGAVGINFTANLQNTGGSLDTIQGIQTSSTPQFLRLGLNQAADTTASLALTQTALGATSTDGTILQNTTAAANNAQQFSPRIRLTGQGWKTNATAASQATDWFIEEQPVQDTTNPDAQLTLTPRINAVNQAPLLICSSTTGAPVLGLFNLDGRTSIVAGCGTNVAVTGIGSVGGNNAFGAYNGSSAPTLNWNTNGSLFGSAKILMWNNGTNPGANNTGDSGLCRGAAAEISSNDGSATCTSATAREFRARTIVAGGAVPGISGCSAGTQVGGNTSGSYASGTTGTCTVTLTFAFTAPNGYACTANDTTTPADVQSQSGTISTTACTITGSTVSGDVITFQARAY